MTTSEREATIRHIAETIASMTEEQFNEFLRRMKEESLISEDDLKHGNQVYKSEAPDKRS